MGGFLQGFFGGMAQGESVPSAVFEGLAARGARKQDRSDKERNGRITEFDNAISGLQKKYSLAQTAEEKSNTMYALRQTILAKNAFLHPVKGLGLNEKDQQGGETHPVKGPGLGTKIGGALHLTKKPQAQSFTTQTGGTSSPAALANPPAANDPRFAASAGAPAGPGLRQRPGVAPVADAGVPVTLPEEPAYQQNAQVTRQPATAGAGAASNEPTMKLTPGTTEPGVEAATLPALPTPAPAMPSQTQTIKRPAYSPKQLRDMAQRSQQAQEETSLLTAAAPNAPENQYTAKRNELIQGGFSKEDADKAVRIMAGLEAKPGAEKPEAEEWEMSTLKLKNGQEIPVQHNKKSGETQTLGRRTLTSEELDGATLLGKPAKPSTAWKNEYAAAYARGHGITPEQLTPADMNFIDQQIALSSSAPSTTVTNTLKQDANGFWVPIQESNRRIPGFGVILSDPRGRASAKVKVPTKDPEPAAATSASTELPAATAGGAAPATPASVPTTPGAAKKVAAKRFNRPAKPTTASATAPGAAKTPRTVGGGTRGFGGVRVGPELFAAPNKDYTETKANLQSAIDRSNTMDKNFANALKGDQQAMLSLVANHIGMTLGGQKGARINQAVWNEAVQSAHLDQRLIAKSFHQDANGDYIFDGWKTGVTLTPDQMKQMVGLAHEKVAVLQSHVDRLQKQLKIAPQTPSGGNSLADRLDKALGGK